MRSAQTQFEESPDSSGGWRGILLAELLAKGAKKSSKGVHRPEDAVLVGFREEAGTTRLKSQKRNGCKWRRTGQFDEPLTRRKSRSGRLLANILTFQT